MTKHLLRLGLLMGALVGVAQPARAQAIIGNVNIGLDTSPACTGDADCTLIGHVRYLDKAVADFWDNVNHRINTAAVVTAVTPGTSATSLGKQQGAAFNANDTGVLMLGRRVGSVAASDCASNGLYCTFNFDDLGRLIITGASSVVQYNQGVTPGSTDTGMAEVAIRTDTPTIHGADTKYIIPAADKYGSRFVSLRKGGDGSEYTPAPDGTVGSTPPTTGPNVLCYAKATGPTAVTDSQNQYTWCDLSGRPQVNISMIGGVAPAMNTGNASSGTPRFVLADNQPTVPTGPTPSATQTAVSECIILSTASTNATNCKGSAGNFYGVQVINTTATLYYLRLYNASGTPTCSSATGFIRTIPVPASTSGSGLTYTPI